MPQTLSGEPGVVWRRHVGEGFASPVVSAGRVFFSDQQEGREMLRAYRESDGEPLWSVAVDETFKDTQGPAGPRCTPLVDGDRVYAQSCRGQLECRRTTDGSRVWGVSYTRDFGAVFRGETGNASGATRHGNNGQPVIEGDWLYASVGSTNGAGMVCFDKRTGVVRWKSGSEVAAYAPPVLATLGGVRQVVNFMSEALTAFEADTGTQLWRVPVKTAFSRHVTTPVIHGDLVIVASHQYGLFAVRISRDGGSWQAKEVWRSQAAAMNFSSPVAVGGFLYGLGPAKDLVCVDLADGSLRWRQEALSTSADKAHAGFLVLGERVLTLTDSGSLILFAADPAAYREAGRAQVCGLNWCNPAYANGRLYLRDGVKGTGDLMALKLTP